MKGKERNKDKRSKQPKTKERKQRERQERKWNEANKEKRKKQAKKRERKEREREIERNKEKSPVKISLQINVRIVLRLLFVIMVGYCGYYSPVSKASREVANLTKRKNPHNPLYGVKEFVCLSVWLR